VDKFASRAKLDERGANMRGARLIAEGATPTQASAQVQEETGIDTDPNALVDMASDMRVSAHVRAWERAPPEAKAAGLKNIEMMRQLYTEMDRAQENGDQAQYLKLKGVVYKMGLANLTAAIEKFGEIGEPIPSTTIDAVRELAHYEGGRPGELLRLFKSQWRDARGRVREDRDVLLVRKKMEAGQTDAEIEAWINKKEGAEARARARALVELYREHVAATP
jgi:hypothetical protein